MPTPSLPPTLADADQLLQVFLNLLKNASEAGKPGGSIRLKTYYDASLRVRRPDGLQARLPLQVEVIDDGPGLPCTETGPRRKGLGLANARERGMQFRAGVERLMEQFPILNLVRGKGLLNAVQLNDAETGTAAWDLCILMAEQGLLAKPTHGNIIRFAPPLIITEAQMEESLNRIERALVLFAKARA